jgi:hypothetical protein
VLYGVYRLFVSGQDPVWAISLPLVALGVVLMLAPPITRLFRPPGDESEQAREVPKDSQIAVYLPDEPCTKLPLEHDGQALGRDGTYCHVAVESLTGATVQACRAHLTRVARMENKEWKVDTRFARPLRLKWAHFALDDPQAEVNDVLPDFPNMVDVVSTDEANPAIAHIVTLDTGSIGIPKWFGPGIYQLTIRVSPKDSPSAVLTVRLYLVENGVVLLLPDHGEPPSPESLAAIVPRASSFGVPTEAYTGGTILYPPEAAGFTGAPGRPDAGEPAARHQEINREIRSASTSLKPDLQRATSLIRRGESLRRKEIGEELDPLTKKYRPDRAFQQVMSDVAKAAEMFGPKDVNAWAEDVARFIHERQPEYADRILEKGLGKVPSAEVVAAIDKNLEVLREIEGNLGA